MSRILGSLFGPILMSCSHAERRTGGRYDEKRVDKTSRVAMGHVLALKSRPSTPEGRFFCVGETRWIFSEKCAILDFFDFVIFGRSMNDS